MRCEPLEGRIALASYTAGTVPELIAAIDSANLSPEDDEITLTAPSYSLTESHATPESWARITPNGALTINGEGATIARDTSSETPAFRLFEVDPGATLHLNDQTLTGGLATKPPGPGTALGGAVLNRGALWLNGVTLDGNTAQGPDGKHLFGVPGTAGGQAR